MGGGTPSPLSAQYCCHCFRLTGLTGSGAASRLQVIKAHPPGVFEEAALASVKQWRFAPAMKDGKPVPYWVELPMPFILK